MTRNRIRERAWWNEGRQAAARSGGVRISLWVGLLLLLLLPGACRDSDTAHTPDHSQAVQIVTTTGMIADAVRNIVGADAAVTALMGPGVDPHLYKATQGDLEKLSDADIIVYNGLHLEGKMGDVLERLAGSRPVIAVAELLPQQDLMQADDFADSFDPHIWFDVALWRAALGHLADSLQRILPAHAADSRSNAEGYLAALDSLDAETRSAIASITEEQRLLITAHDAFGYFGRAYGIEVRGLQGISTVSEFGLRDRADLVKLISQRQIKAIFVESSVSPRAIEAVVEGCRQHGHAVLIGGELYSDAMGAAGTPEGNYIGMVRANVTAIVNALR